MLTTFRVLRSRLFARFRTPIVVPEQAPVLAPAPPPDLLALHRLFLQSGEFVYRSLFKFNHIRAHNLSNRRALLHVLATCTAAEFHALPFAARDTAFKLVKFEAKRYNGTAKRADGSPLPRLAFVVHSTDAKDRANRIEAAKYRALLEQVMTNLTRCVRQ